MKVLKKTLSPIKSVLLNGISSSMKVLNGPYVRGLVAEANKLLFVVDPADMVVGRKLRETGAYGQEELALFAKVTRPDSTVIFIGTHLGALALPIAKKVKKVYLIEANPKTFRFLQMNVAINNIINAELFNCAAGEKSGEINFVQNSKNSGGSKREPVNKQHMYYFDNPPTIRVPMRTLDDMVGQTGAIDLVVMDIEGSEYFALKGMQKTLSQTECLIMEFIPHHLRNVAQVSVEELLTLINPHFGFLYVPSLKKTAEKDEFLTVLKDMMSRDIADDGIIFTKNKKDF